MGDFLLKALMGDSYKETEKDDLPLDKLTDEQRKIITKHFDYLYYLGYVKDSVVGNNKIRVEEYMHSQYIVIAALIDSFEKRNKLSDLGILKE